MREKINYFLLILFIILVFVCIIKTYISKYESVTNPTYGPTDSQDEISNLPSNNPFIYLLNDTSANTLFNYVQDTPKGYFCLDVSNNGVVFNPCNNSKNQEWYNNKTLSNYNTIINNTTKDCLTITKNGYKNVLDIKKCKNTPGQNWLYNPDNNLVQNSLSGPEVCLNTSNNKVIMDRCNKNVQHKWYKINISDI